MQITLEKLKKSRNITLNEEQNKIIVYPLNRINIIDYPLPPNHEECVELTLDEYIAFTFVQAMFEDDTYSKVIDFQEFSDEEFEKIDQTRHERYKKYTNYLGVE